MLLQHDKTQGESAEDSKRRIAQLEEFASGIQALILHTQEEVNRTQKAIQALIDSTKHDGSSSALRPGAVQERDRPVFDPCDYKIEVLRSRFALGVWKNVEARGRYLHRHHRHQLARSQADPATGTPLAYTA